MANKINNVSLNHILYCYRHFYSRSIKSIWDSHELKLLVSLKNSRKHKLFFRTFAAISSGSSVSKPISSTNVLSQVSFIESVPSEIKIEKSGRITLDAVPLSTFERTSVDAILEKFKLKGLKFLSIERYSVAISQDNNSLFFPMEDASGDLSAVQYLKIENYPQNSVTEHIFPKENGVAIFGFSKASQKDSAIVVTSNPTDAIAVNQETGMQAVSVPFENSLLLQVAKLFTPFQKTILWFNSTLHNWEIHKLFVEVLGKNVNFVSPIDCPSTPLNSLKKGMSLKIITSNARPLKHDSVETFAAFKEATYQEFKDYQKSSGMKWKRFPVLNDVLKGLRKGELTVFSGQTGTGKTTFMSEYSLDLCMQKVPTLWGSFEVSNVRLIKTMITQFSMFSFKDCPEQYHRWASEFQKLPMFFLNFSGQHALRDVIEAMKHTVIVYGIEHVVIDNLQFMMNSDDLNSTVDQLRRQDQIFGAFRQFATQYQCHVTLVMHPRKEPEFSELSNTSISGSAKAIQEADNIILLQTTKTRQYLQITKNRFDGHKGCVLLEFDKRSLTFQIKRTPVSKTHQPSSSTSDVF